jgi:hypothetical protein
MPTTTQREILQAAVNDIEATAAKATVIPEVHDLRATLNETALELRGIARGLRLCLAQMPDADAIAAKMIPDAPQYTLEEYKYALERACDVTLAMSGIDGATLKEFITGALDGARKTLNAQYPQCECGRWVYRDGKWSNNSGITLSEAECWQCHTLCNPDGSTVPPDTLAAAETVPTEDVSMAGVG